MTTSSVLRAAIETADTVVTAPRYSLVVSSDRQHRVAAQRLRHRIFTAEPGFCLQPSSDGLDADRFDDFCDHLLVRHEATGEFVGCYRMLPPDGAVEAGGYYTATEFDISALDPVGNRMVEMGRACVDPSHRSGSVLSLMWSGIIHYLQLTGYEWVMGCVSVPMRETPGAVAGSNVRGVRDLLLSRYGNDPAARVVPKHPVRVEGVNLDEIPAPARAVLPPLLRGYLRLGARICGEPAHDAEFGVADFVALHGLRTINERYLERLQSASATLEAGIPA
ncbi:phosphohistidine phosphatase [Rhodococcus sp. WMMA185]|uniref:GNAT family N-acetyltransferase n=1 Tax=Rhodococcus sp. WMMA185 TaxID=679318 RepID=UPI000878922D|nr:GNAT family N-acyltransferase [Rhodococcus sp. WMMA185]AOW92317.1 phosphohistidine phosphatase [Rhodococcus sp. WMMA185]